MHLVKQLLGDTNDGRVTLEEVNNVFFHGDHVRCVEILNDVLDRLRAPIICDAFAIGG